MPPSGARVASTSTTTERGFPNQPPAGERFDGLDGLRGLAALSVFVSHAVDLVPERALPARLVNSPAHLLFDGMAAVDLFFVLSGFVLALPFVGPRAKRAHYPSFAVRRLFRLYPAYWASLLLALAFRTLLFDAHGLGGLSAWVNGLWARPLSTSDLLRHALMIGPSFDTDRLDPVIWSLVTEMRMSLLFPLILLAVRPVARLRGAVAVVAGSIAFTFVAARIGVHTFTYLPMFVLGAALAAVRGQLLGWAARLRPATAALLAALALVLYDVRFALGGLRFDYDAEGLVIAAGSALLVVLVAGRASWSAQLTRPAVRFLGRVSYSFYLIHLPLLLLLAAWLHPRLPSLPLIVATALAASLALSQLLYRWVELPSHLVGRRVAERLTPARASRPALLRPLPLDAVRLPPPAPPRPLPVDDEQILAVENY